MVRTYRHLLYFHTSWGFIQEFFHKLQAVFSLFCFSYFPWKKWFCFAWCEWNTSLSKTPKRRRKFLRKLFQSLIYWQKIGIVAERKNSVRVITTFCSHARRTRALVVGPFAADVCCFTPEVSCVPLINLDSLFALKVEILFPRSNTQIRDAWSVSLVCVSVWHKNIWKRSQSYCQDFGDLGTWYSPN